MLVGSPGAPPRRLEDLATVKDVNPVKTPDGGQVPDLPVKPLVPGKRSAVDPPAPDLGVAPEGLRAAVIEYARKVSKAATSQPVPHDNGPVVGRTLPSRARSLQPATGAVPSTDVGKPDGDQ